MCLRLLKVPYAWRQKTSLTGIYGLSSFTYCGVGAYLLYLLKRFPAKALPGSQFEAYLFLWQGFTSYMCDVCQLFSLQTQQMLYSQLELRLGSR